MEPGDGGWIRLPEREREQERGGPAPAPALPAHREASAPQSFRDILAQGIAACNEDLVPAQRGGLFVARGGGASDNDVRRYDATLYETQHRHGRAYNVAS